MEHSVVSKTPGERLLIRVECACGYYQQTTILKFIPSVWLSDEQHMEWAAQNAPAQS